MIETGDGLVVEDSRACAAAPLHRLTGAEHEILLLGDGAPTEKQMLTDLSQNFSEAESARAIEALVAAKLLLPIDGRLLALPTLGHARSPKPNIQHPLGMILPREKVRDAHLSAAE
jgi:hypothetical protein